MRAHLIRVTAGAAVLNTLLAAFASTAEAQATANSFDQLRLLVKTGDTISVTDTTGREITGQLTALSSSSLALLRDGAQQELTERDITKIRQRRSDSLANGALWGLLSGAALGTTLVATFWESGDSETRAVAFVATYAGLGTAVGVGVDALIRGRHVIYERPSAATSISIAPMLAGPRRGILVSMRF